MSEFINTIEYLGDNVAFKKLVEGTLTEFKDNALINISDYCFSSYNTLTDIELPNAKTFGKYVLGSTGLTTVDFPSATTFGNGAFTGCASLKTVNLPNATSFGSSAFYSCSALTSIVLPKVATLGESAFNMCTALTTVDLPKLQSVNKNSFYYCPKLTTLILRNGTKCTLKDTSSFTSTPIRSGSGYIYVPDALLTSYKNDTYWSSYKNRFRALESYTVDGTTTGALDPAKI